MGNRPRWGSKDGEPSGEPVRIDLGELVRAVQTELRTLEPRAAVARTRRDGR